MKQKNFLFVDIVSSIFLLVLFMGNFLGLLYITDSNFMVSIIASLLVVVCYYFILQMLKRNKERMANKGYKDAGMLFFFFFFAFGIGSFFIITHLINIEKNVKVQLQTEAEQVIEKAKSASEIYHSSAMDAMQTFEANFKTKLQAYKETRSNALWNELSNEPYKLPESILKSPSSTIDVSASSNAILQSYRVKIEANKKNIDSLQIQNIESITGTILRWDRFNVMKSYLKLNAGIAATETYINARIKELPVQKESIKIAYSGTHIPLDNPFQLAKQYKPNYLIPAIVVLIMHLFILIPFFTHKIRIYPKSSNQRDENSRSGAIEL
ncbi:hypothetical protein SAMN05660841_04092 [Sphingobacterium nematocida]|uniref:Uncharacterized protein n=1 Tax=Sphingobacterium nematocida TaxID=1513896 RepID=A0A1T5GI42_9SPHI|nr:hypothetical protein [Sphingobacterium nematocida]SKC08078.1 hypothetical protein SAMN05660841_04092 [Sphingobacterium nematocida]